MLLSPVVQRLLSFSLNNILCLLIFLLLLILTYLIFFLLSGILQAIQQSLFCLHRLSIHRLYFHNSDSFLLFSSEIFLWIFLFLILLFVLCFLDHLLFVVLPLYSLRMFY